MDNDNQDQIRQIDVLDSEEIPSKYRERKVASGNSQNDSKHRATPRDQSTSASKNNPPTMFTRLRSWASSPEQAPTKDSSERSRRDNHKRQRETKEHPSAETDEVNGASEQIVVSKNKIDPGQASEIIKEKEREWKSMEQEFQSRLDDANHLLEERTRVLEAKLHESEREKLAMQEQHDAFIRKQQEASFKQMESARWLPIDEGKVMVDLDRLKKDMRSWAKAMATKTDSLPQSLEKRNLAALMQDLAKVTRIENGQLPEGLSATSKTPMLLLNALLAHSVYTSFFRDPFFFISKSNTKDTSNIASNGVLEDIYERAKDANLQDAHIWRSQTLRMLMPPLRNDSSDAEQKLHSSTKDLIARAADHQAEAFMASSAAYLIENKADIMKLKKIYSNAAAISYMLGTRRTEMRCITFHETGSLFFDADSSEFDPDNLVRYDDHDDNLKGRVVDVMVHPLLKVYGSDEAQDYDEGRVWVKGIVWLDSKTGKV